MYCAFHGLNPDVQFSEMSRTKSKTGSSSEETANSLTPAAPVSLASDSNVPEIAKASLVGRRTRGEAAQRGRWTTADSYWAVWKDFEAFLTFRRTSSKAALAAWANKEYKPSDRLSYLHTHLASITYKDIIVYKNLSLNKRSKGGLGISRSTMYLRLAALRHLFKTAMLEGAIEENPARKDFVNYRYVKENKRKRHVLTAEEVVTILSDLAREQPTKMEMRNWMLVKLLASTGMRRQECSELFVGDFYRDGENAFLKLRLKGDKRNDLLLAEELEMDIDGYLFVMGLESGPMFPSQKRGPNKQTVALTPAGITKLVNKITKTALGKKYGPHSFRHFFANEALRNGADVLWIKEYLGHEDIKTTFEYLSLEPERGKSAGEFINLGESNEQQTHE